MSLASLNEIAQANIEALYELRRAEEESIRKALEGWLSTNRVISLSAIDELVSLCSNSLRDKIISDECSLIAGSKIYEILITTSAELSTKLTTILECERCMRLPALIDEYNASNSSNIVKLKSFSLVQPSEEPSNTFIVYFCL